MCGIKTYFCVLEFYGCSDLPKTEKTGHICEIFGTYMADIRKRKNDIKSSTYSKFTAKGKEAAFVEVWSSQR